MSLSELTEASDDDVTPLFLKSFEFTLNVSVWVEAEPSLLS